MLSKWMIKKLQHEDPSGEMEVKLRVRDDVPMIDVARGDVHFDSVERVEDSDGVDFLWLNLSEGMSLSQKKAQRGGK